MNVKELRVTRQELVRLSEFSLPKRSATPEQWDEYERCQKRRLRWRPKHRLCPDGGKACLQKAGYPCFPEGQEHPAHVPGLTVDQVRGFEKHGLFDEPVLKAHGSPAELQIWWKVRRRKQGATRLYSVLDVATARLTAWLLRDGAKHREIERWLRGTGNEIKAFIPGDDDFPLLGLWPDGGACLVEQQVADGYPQRYPGCPPLKIYRLAWLGIESDALPRIQKMREKRPAIHMWNRVELPAAIAAHQAEIHAG